MIYAILLCKLKFLVAVEEYDTYCIDDDNDDDGDNK